MGAEDLSVDELVCNLTQLVQHAYNVPSHQDQSVPLLEGKRVRQSFVEDDTTKWYNGRVISQVTWSSSMFQFIDYSSFTMLPSLGSSSTFYLPWFCKHTVVFFVPKSIMLFNPVILYLKYCVLDMFIIVRYWPFICLLIRSLADLFIQSIIHSFCSWFISFFLLLFIWKKIPLYHDMIFKYRLHLRYLFWLSLRL